MRVALLCLALVASALSTADAAGPLKTFVFTNEVPSGAVDEQLQARRESLRDLVSVLSSAGYQQAFTLVNSRAAADVVIELTSRGESTASAGASSSRASAGATASASQSSTVTKRFLKFRVVAGKRAGDLTTEDQLPWP